MTGDNKTVMINHRYGTFNSNQFESFKTKMRKKIFWLILYTDERTNANYKNINVKEYQKNLMKQISAFNSLLFYPDEMVDIINNLEAARLELEKSDFNFKTYKKFVLDAGDYMLALKVGQSTDDTTDGASDIGSR